MLNEIPQSCDYLIAVGAGTVHDITRYCAHEKKIPFVSCPTAASVDGFCSSVAAMTWDGFKKTFEAVAPKIVVADLDVISKAPTFLTNSGFGDMVGKFIALADWKIANEITEDLDFGGLFVFLGVKTPFFTIAPFLNGSVTIAEVSFTSCRSLFYTGKEIFLFHL